MKGRGRRNNLKIALVGNPNVGKSSLFNYLTGLGVQVANYPGTTVELYKGKTRMQGRHLEIIDLPGCYSISDQSVEGKIVRDYLIEEKPDVVIDVIDANLLDRNLYMALQLAEMEIPTVIALNFYEECQDCGFRVEHQKLEQETGIPVVPIDALRGAGVMELTEKAVETRDKPPASEFSYDDHIEDAIKRIVSVMPPSMSSGRAFALRLLQDDKDAWRTLDRSSPETGDKIRSIIKENSRQHDLPAEIARERHGQADMIASRVKVSDKGAKQDRQEKLDRLTTEPLSGTLIMLGMLLLLFSALFFLGGFLEETIAALFEGTAAPALQSMIAPIENEALRTSLEYSLIWGIEAGLTIVIPYILVFYFILSFLEDTGYLPRMGYLLDRIMHKVGLHGKAIVPMLLGFGCTVPALMSTRLLQSQREKTITAILVSFIPLFGQDRHNPGGRWFLLGLGICAFDIWDNIGPGLPGRPCVKQVAPG
jgi:ferrous iron transport protein B